MKLLRDKSLSTQMLILSELYTEHYSKLVPLAEKIGVTQQAISNYIKKMSEQDLVHRVKGEYRPTIKGTQLLQTELLNLKKFIDDRIKKMSIIKTCIALARSKIKTGEKVGLFMEKGWLVAYPNKKSTSTGIAKIDADIGEAVIVSELNGIVSHKVGKMYYFELPSLHKVKRLTNTDVDRLRKKIKTLNLDKIGILDATAKSVCKKIGLKPDFEFGGIYASIDAVQRGLNTGLFGYEEKIREAIAIFEKMNEKSGMKTYYEVFSI